MAGSSAVKANNRGSRPKGEQTRQKILDATLGVIARYGVAGTTHRAIAKEAGVQLSLTTYYFKDLNELIALAFRRFMERGHADMGVEWQKAFRYLDQFSTRELKDTDVRRRIVEYCSKRVLDHMRWGLTESREGLAVEHHFFFEALNDRELQKTSEQHRAELMKPMIAFCQYFNETDPETDASLLLGTILRLEYEALPYEADEIDFVRMRREIRRIMGWIVDIQ